MIDEAMSERKMLKGLEDAKYLQSLAYRTIAQVKTVTSYADMASKMIRLAAKRGITIDKDNALEMLYREQRRRETVFERRNFR